MGKVERKVAILEVLSQKAEPTRPLDVGEIIGETALETGRLLFDMKASGLVQKPDKKKPFYEITDKGRGYMEDPPEEVKDEEEESSRRKEAHKLGGQEEKKSKHRKEAHKDGGQVEDTTANVTEETEAIPSQSDLLRKEGELLGVGTKKGELRLDTIIKFVQRTADLGDLNSVWNALTEMGVANDVKKRWIRLYAQNLPGKQIPEELKEKLELGQEGDKVSTEGKGEIQPKPKRFSLVGNDIIGDPEGDLTFNEALKLLALKEGVPSEQASPLAAMIEAMKMGPEMATQTLTAMAPLLLKEPPKGENSLLQFMQTQMTALQQMIVNLTEEKHKAEMESLKTLITTGQRPPEADQRLEALTKQIETLRESLHQEQLTRMTEQSQRTTELLQGEIKGLEERITQAAQSMRVESSLGILSKTIEKIDNQATGIRQDAKPFIETIIKAGGPGPTPRSPEEKARLAIIGKEAVEKERRARQLEDELLSS